MQVDGEEKERRRETGSVPCGAMCLRHPGTQQQIAARPTSAELKDYSSDSTANEDRQLSLDRFTWANFTCTQSTSGVAVLLSETPIGFAGCRPPPS